MNLSQAPVTFRGPDRFCPDCGRLLVKIHENGTFDLMGNAGMMARGELNTEEESFQEALSRGVEAVVMEATCLDCHPEHSPSEPQLPPEVRDFVGRLFGFLKR